MRKEAIHEKRPRDFNFVITILQARHCVTCHPLFHNNFGLLLNFSMRFNIDFLTFCFQHLFLIFCACKFVEGLQKGKKITNVLFCDVKSVSEGVVFLCVFETYHYL